MSRRLAVFFCTVMLAPGAAAQDVYGPGDLSRETDGDEPVPLVEPQPCEEEIREDGAIVVCRELPDSERYLSPLPKPVEVHVNDLGGLRGPPCWVTQGESLGCMRIGSVPPYPPLIDLTAFPEALSEQEIAAISAVPEEAREQSNTRIGERVAIDLSGDD